MTNRPDLSKVSKELKDYIESLEAELELLRSKNETMEINTIPESIVPKDTYEHNEPPEPETTISLISMTASGIGKRTPRHLYNRQRRGGMGIFDLDTNESDPPRLLAVADLDQSLLVLTNYARAFRLPVKQIPSMAIRSKGKSSVTKLGLNSDEKIAALLTDKAEGYIGLLSQSGKVRVLRHHVFGEYMKPGTSLYDYKSFGPLVAACWTPGDNDLFIATRNGRAIRFAQRLVSPQGTQAIRLQPEDCVVGITPVEDSSGVLLLSQDGKGTIRLMGGFAANKAPGAGGKIAMHTDRLICALNVDDCQDVFIISKLGKIIRFRIDEIPTKVSPVQGVICMSLRADEITAVAHSS